MVFDFAVPSKEFSIGGSDGVLSVKSDALFEDYPDYSIPDLRIRVTDPDNLKVEGQFPVVVLKKNVVPHFAPPYLFSKTKPNPVGACATCCEKATTSCKCCSVTTATPCTADEDCSGSDNECTLTINNCFVDEGTRASMTPVLGPGPDQGFVRLLFFI